MDNYPQNPVSRPELMRQTGLDRRTIRKMEREGLLHPFKEKQNSVLYELAEVREMVSQRNKRLMIHFED